MIRTWRSKMLATLALLALVMAMMLVMTPAVGARSPNMDCLERSVVTVDIDVPRPARAQPPDMMKPCPIWPDM